MSTCRSGHCAVAVGDMFYVLGGYDGSDVLISVECFDPRRRRWREVAPMAESRKDFAAAVLEGEIYVLGGQDDDGQQLDSVERYNPASNEWSSVKPMNTVRGGPAAVVLEG